MTKEATPEQVVEFMTNVMKTTPEQTITMLLTEVERLQADIESLRGLNNQLLADCAKAEAEVERLKTALGPGATEAWEHMYDEIEQLKAALKPFASNVDAISLRATLGHITREDLWRARDALAGNKP